VPRSTVSRCAGRSGYSKVGPSFGEHLFPHAGSPSKMIITRRIGVTPQERRDMPWIICACAITGFILFGTMIYRLVS
jgi:hypothetical protein